MTDTPSDVHTGPHKPSVPLWARKSTLVLLAALLAVAVFGTTTQSWIVVHVDSAAVAGGELQVQGSKAATAVTALAVVAVAGALAASIAGRVSRWIISGIVVFAAAGIAVAAATVLANPLAAAQGSIAAVTGVSGGQSNATATAYPVLAIVAAGLLAAVALLIVPAGRHWRSRTKYETSALRGRKASGPVDEIDSWDRLTRGEDPT
ncbi:Trp biosynthesis-associated membrane protein [Arthrobacter sp. M4]|uniref:Trp biosynthesis-associated membrane protein n=1 Tax=Arthrobacter sp. M4 TaxID=218160 RepID=UPI001CDC724D|nr:Trp biosynthesis-associated membrane protein [Arthrobacter sp. M4]MCA4132671.1 Trp biosynthesis-associated membrane protein [Arthrobacter sp. M4]